MVSEKGGLGDVPGFARGYLEVVGAHVAGGALDTEPVDTVCGFHHGHIGASVSDSLVGYERTVVEHSTASEGLQIGPPPDGPIQRNGPSFPATSAAFEARAANAKNSTHINIFMISPLVFNKINKTL